MQRVICASVAQPFRAARAADRRPEGLRYDSARAHAASIVTMVLLFAAIARAQTPTPAPPAAATAAIATGTIRGHVVAADSGQPLRRVDVRLIRTDSPAGGINRGFGGLASSARTDGDGKYEFADIPAGRYQISATKPAYVMQTWGQSQPTAPPKPVELHGGETLDRIDFSLQRGGVITGRIVDEFGEPLSGVDIRVLQTRAINGRRDLQESGFAATNDLGEFRVFGITPGQYYVKTMWRRTGMPVDPASPDRTGYPDTYFPGTLTVDDAQRLTVRAGETIADLVMALSPIATVRVEGTVVDSNGKPAGPANLMVMKSGSTDGPSFGSPVRPDGTFIISSMTAGEYTLRAQSFPPRKETATLKITVGTEDIKDVRLIAAPPSAISGRVVVDPAQAQSLPNPVMFTASPVDSQFFMGMEPTRVGDDLSFTMTAAAGRYRINWMNLSAGWMIRAIRINNTDVTDDDLVVKAGENIGGVEIELTNRSSSIAGTVMGRSGVPSKDYRLIIFAADKKLWTTASSRYFRVGGPDKDGRFKVGGLPPGTYSVVALEHLDVQVPFNDPDFLQRISPSADTVTLADGESRTIDLRVTSVQP